ncbi:ribonuclease E inhibitor RraB [Pseudoalteromonas luteoviolacea]|uniref:Regulator of ribonuclease activity B domain-containing protein n=1 Tax=Pseudoalteromonas luteoviolacea H33 TaxID=1365251 RepID=A0A167A7Q4_9GAMM|nr:ribonuclease E inhibitor RraB [Pseudoalteromonas luteoviolacea]KZN45074.1 hypothetical protein N476_25820 [Pseudoalteromonas luteoviolacea H33]KZN79252.1 hypothetical protein N477_00195 [Pseudoalteromonas luteoviolacea H33-S]MBQ4877894.1 ribonuclease E inhibitor RraB [Pseudoalteromonas luteoviolacea]MBQ4906929.1 ribonuclease E inhibitor RraB [Pseudoalteromonas luteoviolacea]
MTDTHTWPADADGEVLKVLDERGFDFGSTHTIEFYLEFKTWPLSEHQQNEISEKLHGADFIESDPEDIELGDAPGYVLFTTQNKVTHEFVGQEQVRLSKLVAHLDGTCNSWAVCSPCGG